MVTSGEELDQPRAHGHAPAKEMSSYSRRKAMATLGGDTDQPKAHGHPPAEEMQADEKVS